MDDKAAEFSKWVERNSVPHARHKARTEGHFASMVANAQLIGPVVANAKLIGPNAAQALTLDRQVQAARDSGNNQGLHDVLAGAPATGCAMVLSLAVQASGYNPLNPAAAGNLGGFTNYISQILQCPVFSAALRDEVNPNLSADWGTVISNIVSLYQGIQADDLSTIRNGLYSLAQAASSTPGANETETLFVQSTINYGEQLSVFMYWSSVQMVTNVQSGGKHSPDIVTNTANLTLYRNILNFDAAAWPRYAPIIMSKTSASLDSWLTNNTTPQGPIPVNWNQ